jgi:hypothetical protein
VLFIKYCADDKIEKNGMGEHIALMGERRGVCRVLVGYSKGKRQLGRLRPRGEDDITTDL